MKAKILMIEDNADLLRTNRAELEEEGYQVFEARTLAEGNRLIQNAEPDLILLDILLPDGNGLEYCRNHLNKGEAGVLFLSALNTSQDVIAGLRAGGDDYIVKPYLMEEMIARVEALLRRSKKVTAGQQNYVFHDLILNPVSMHAYVGTEDMGLTAKEFKLLELLLQNRNKYISSKALYGQLWGMDAISNHPIKQLVYRLRVKLADADVVIKSEKGKGYMITGKE